MKDANEIRRDFGPRLDPNPGAYRPIVALAVIALVLLACVGSPA